MAPLTAWLPAQHNQDFDLAVTVAGPGVSGLVKEWAPIAQSLTHQGLVVMAHSGRLYGEFGDCVLSIRLATRPFHSMGHGCDVLVHLGDRVPEFRHFNLQPGSVLLWEPPTEPRPGPSLPDGLIAYPVPLADLGNRRVEGLRGKALAAFGVLLHLLGFSEGHVHHVTSLIMNPQSFTAGWDYARRKIKKRDAYALPLPTTEGESCKIIVTPQQAVMAGFAACSCECGTSCDHELIKAPAQWMARHIAMASSVVSVLQSNHHPDVQTYRGHQGTVTALIGGNDSALGNLLYALDSPKVLVAADIPDTVKLLMTGHDLVRRGLNDGVGVLIEERIALQSVEIRGLVDILSLRSEATADSAPDLCPTSSCLTAEREGDLHPPVGLVAWGEAQGVVRDVIALCRDFGIPVAGLYPKLIVPFPKEELELFAKTVDRVVLVESRHTQRYRERLRTTCSFRFSVLAPSPGQSLTPMDIFLREGLGAV